MMDRPCLEKSLRCKGEGAAVKKKDDTHRNGRRANKAFSTL